MKKRHLATLTLLVAAAVSISPASATTTTPAAQRANPKLEPSTESESDGTYIHSFSTIRAKVSLIDTGSSLAISGQGIGFNPTLSYTSFFYGTGSVRTGSLACIPPLPNNLTVPQMITAYWLPVGSTRRTLTVVNTGTSYTPLSTIGTMSVRYDSTPTLPLSTNLNPGRFWLNACGSVR